MVKRGQKETKVDLKNEKLVCSCRDDVFFGIPCRHQLAIFTKLDCLLSWLPFNNRWLLTNKPPDFDEPLNLSKEKDKIKVN